jgi:AraC-like DNA-binding protein
MHAVARENHRGLKMHVPITLLQMAGLDTCDVWTRLIGGESVYVESDGAASTHLRRLIHVALYEPSRASEQSDRAGELISCLHSIVTLSGESQSRDPTGSLGEKQRVIKRSREYIEAHLFEPIHIGEVCRCAATSISKLERMFRHELQMSPSQYILKRRLIRVNKALKQNGSGNARVTQVAMEYGFNHLGRFANAYSTQFGELPSETVSHN